MKPVLLFAISLIFAAVAASAAAPVDLLAGGTWSLGRPHPEDAELTVLNDQHAPGGRGPVLRIEVHKPSEPFYLIQLTQTVAPTIPEGALLRYHFWSRSPNSNPLRVVVEKNGPPYNSVLEQHITLTPEWKEYTITGSGPGYGPNGLGARLQVGEKAGVLEFADIRLENLGMDPALAAAQAAITPENVRARIARFRMGDLLVVVKDARSRPLPGARVNVEQTRHAFLFGCNLFGLNLEDSSPAQKAYQERFSALLNYATVPFYWGSFEWQAGKPQYERLEKMARWCQDHGITVKGHTLVWHEVYPRWAPADPDGAIPLLHQRVTDIITHYRDMIHIWDVINEANGAAGFSPPNGESRWIQRDGPAKVVATALGWAREAGKGTAETFIYNDYDTGTNNVALLTQLQADHNLPDVIGLQSHMHGGTWPLTKVWKVCETFARFGKPIHFTETTVLSGPQRSTNFRGPNPTDWNTTPEYEAKQADYVAQFYSLLFSHPSVQGITWWDFSDSGAWMGAPAGLVRKDMSPKPVYERLMDLIHKEWWTRVSGETDKTGAYRVRAFYGDYKIVAADSKGRQVTQTVTLPQGSGPQRVEVVIKD